MPDAPDRLDSWKEIAAYLGREVRTVQGSEKNEGLPIHRHQHARQGSVYGFKSELDAWRQARVVSPASPETPGRESRRRWLFAGLTTAAALVTAVSWGVFYWRSGHGQASTSEALSSVAVLPFLDLSPQKDQEYFSDGLTEEIIDALSRVPNLRVAARTSAFSFKDKSLDIRDIGRQLNVSAVLEGSVRKSGDDLRITAQLNRVSDGYHLWSRIYERRLSDIFVVQRELSQSIADQLRAGEVPDRAITSSVEAHRLYQEGHYFFSQHQVPESYRKAIDRYQQAIALDPNYAAAYAGLADAYAYLAEQFAVAPAEAMPKARAAAEKALALDSLSADAHTSLGLVKLDYEWDVAGAQREFRRAMQLNPSSGYIRHWYAHSLEAQDRLEDAMKEMRAAQALDPLLLVLSWDIVNELYWAGRNDEALRGLKKAGELFPNIPLLTYLTAEIYQQTGDVKAARRVLDGLATRQPEAVKEPAFLALFGTQAAREGRRDEARRTLEQLETIRRTQYVEPVLMLDLCSALNDRNQRMVWLNRAYQERSALFPYLRLQHASFAGDRAAITLIASVH
jgi:TolB-like protein/Tfp pilus assembly protein PilF